MPSRFVNRCPPAKESAFMSTPLSQHCPDWATALCAGFSQIFLQRQPMCGVMCLLAIAVGAPELLGGALLGGAVGLLTAQRRDYPKAQRQAGLYSYNGILLGLLLSHTMPWSALLPLLIIASAGTSALLTHQWLKRAPGFAVYTAPFVGIGWVLLALVNEPAPALINEQVINGWTLLLALFKGVGQAMLLPHPICGLLIVLGLCLSHWRAALWALLGSLAGLAWGLYAHDTAPALNGLVSYNPVLIALAVSQQSPSRWLPLLGIALALLLTPLFSALGLPTLTAPFIAAGWLMQAGLRGRDSQAQRANKAGRLPVKR